MAQSRLERIGTIYSRTKSLVQGGAHAPEDLPLWYAVYEAFPPKREPLWYREAPETPIRQIFYEEDVVRAKFQKRNRDIRVDLASSRLTETQRFLEKYKELKQSTPDATEDELYEKSKELYGMPKPAVKKIRIKEIFVEFKP